MTLNSEAMSQLEMLGSRPERSIPLDRALLLLSKANRPDLDIERYLMRLDELAADAREALADADNLGDRVRAFTRFMAERRGFRGNVEEYYDLRNSLLSEVMDRRVGIPITLSSLYLEVGRRVGIDLVGIGFPFHFLLGVPDLHDTYLDPFHGSDLMDRKDCEGLLDKISDGRIEFEERFLETVDTRQIFVRVLRNLKNIYSRTGKPKAAIEVSSLILTWRPHQMSEYRDRGLQHLERKNWEAAIEDFQQYLAHRPNAGDARAILQQLQFALSKSIPRD